MTPDEVLNLIVSLILKTMPPGDERSRLFIVAARWHADQTRTSEAIP